MLTLRNRTRIAILLTLALILLAGSALAAKDRKSKGREKRQPARSKQAAKAPARVQQQRQTQPARQPRINRSKPAPTRKMQSFNRGQGQPRIQPAPKPAPRVRQTNKTTIRRNVTRQVQVAPPRKDRTTTVTNKVNVRTNNKGKRNGTIDRTVTVSRTRKESGFKSKPAKHTESRQTRMTKVVTRADKKVKVGRDRAITYTPAKLPRQTKQLRSTSRQLTRGGSKVDRSSVTVRKQVAPNRTKKTVTERTRITTKNQRQNRGHGGGGRTEVVRTVKREIHRPRVVKQVNRHGQGHSRGRGGHTKTKVVNNIHYHNNRFGHHPNRIYTRIVWPSYSHRIVYHHGPSFIYRHLRPHYHRKYVFVSIGGWWPSWYTHRRYYYYGWHPYRWYGSYPIAYRLGGETHNYYTYNYYGSSGTSAYSTYSSSPLAAVDHTTFADVRERLAEQAEPDPDAETLADKFFEDGVLAFEAGDYDTAIKAFADAKALEPDDVILPFTYVQALFADEQYFAAAAALRDALENLPSDQEGLFFPRGLYGDDELLVEQIAEIEKKAEVFTYDADLPLLLGYQLLGTGRHDEAVESLKSALDFERNRSSAAILLNLLAKLQEESIQL